MNERIKELWENSTGATVPEDGYYSSASKYNIEKFAELIVQECAEIARLNTRVDSNVYLMIQEHFGVEE
jgi:hypothetical protein